MAADRLIIQIESREDLLDLDHLVTVASSTLATLHAIEREIGEPGSAHVHWAIEDVSISSPLRLTVRPVSEHEPSPGPRIIEAYTNGLRWIEADAKPGERPPFFSNAALESVKHLASVLNNGVQRLTVSELNGQPISLTQQIAAVAGELLPKAHEELGTIEGRLEMISVHRGNLFAIWEVFEGRRIECRFPDELLERARNSLGRRVAVTGRIHYTGKGYAQSIQVDDLRELREQRDLPQAKDLEDIDITGAADPVEYVRRLRDAG